MKKAKIALTVVAVLAVVGGALAFKARTPHNFYQTDAANGCSQLVTLTYQQTFLPTNGRDIISTQLSTAPTATACPVITIKTVA